MALGDNVWSTAMKFVLVNDRPPRVPSICACCSQSVASSYLRDLSSKKLYCNHNCYLATVVPFVGSSIDGLSILCPHRADDFRRAAVTVMLPLEPSSPSI